MRNIKFRFFLAAFSLMSILIFNLTANAAPVKFNQVVQVVNVKPGSANTGSFAQLRLTNDFIVFGDTDGDEDKNKTPQQDDRVITETKTEIVEDEVCECEDVQEEVVRRGFPKWALLGLAAIPIAFLVTRDKDNTPTPTPTPTTTPTMTPTNTPTPTPTPTATPTPTPTMTPTMTPTPTPPPEPVPEPMTILLFGTGLAGVGLAARRKFGKKKAEKSE
jgi:cell division protein FtsN